MTTLKTWVNLDSFLWCCLYKILGKLLANRMRKVLGKVIDHCQSAFHGGRILLHSVLVVNEVVEDAKRRKSPSLLFKVDFEKAYNFVSWEFLLYMLYRLGFQAKWITWIKGCLESPCSLVLVNVSPSQEFQRHKGLR